MSLPVVIQPMAAADIKDIYESLEAALVGLGDRFIVRLREKLNNIERMPEMYGIVWNDVRATRLKKFHHVLYYVVLQDRVEVIAILHGSRDAPVWQSRL